MANKDMQVQCIARIASFKASGQTQTARCAAQGLSINKLKYWLNKLGETSKHHKASEWVPLKLNISEAIPANNTLLVRIGSATVEVNPGFDQKHLLDVSKTLRALCSTASEPNMSTSLAAALVKEGFSLDPFSPCLFVFCNRKRDKLKILQCDHNGFWLHYRRLEKGKFQWPDGSNGNPVSISHRELIVGWPISAPSGYFLTQPGGAESSVVI